MREDDTILVVGLGDLGARVAYALCGEPAGRLVLAARQAARAEEVAGQAALIAALRGGPRRVQPASIDLDDVDGTAEQLARIAPGVIVLAASRLTWWRLPETAATIPYGVWVPVHAALVRRLMKARAAAGVVAPVVALAYPDAVGPVLAGESLAPDAGAGNVLEMAAKLQVVAAEAAGVARDEVAVRLVAHHATERAVFSVFGGLGGSGGPSGPPPMLARIEVGGRALEADAVRGHLDAAYALPDGRATHELTAAATAATVAGLLSDVPVALHVPAPGGLPGGYPVLASRSGVALDLPEDVSEADAVAVNAVAARWDGIERIDADGTVTFSGWATDAVEAALGLRLGRLQPAELDAAADELVARVIATGRAHGGR